ncbi:MAG: tRNA (N(6)-L-threonylcarbamoyladenosine(37)-C(2))-methylthiotransferase MtaB [Bariatricus sp.]
MKKAALHNLGCKVNAYETEAMQELLEKNGYQIVPFQDEADIYIINTCSVTNIADRKSRQMIHRARKQNPDAVIVAAGCYVQARTDAGEKDENIDIVIGNNKKQELIGILDAYFAQKEKHQQIEVIDINHTAEYEELALTRTAEHTRAYLKVQDGCNQFCTYCIIPYARGRVRSRKKEEVVREVETLAANGYREVVLTGIHLSSYGVELKDENGQQQEDLLSLIRAVHEVEGIARIRLGSLEPRIITEEFACELSKLTKICPHFHLSLQSGCNATLKRMNRRYTAEEYYDKCRILRKYFENPALTTDVITGFPGETEEEFEESVRFVDKVDFYETHIFKYSKRRGTKAAEMKGQITEQEKARRSAVLQELNERKQEKYEKQWVGKEAEVLFEEVTEKEGQKMVTGHTREYLKISVPCTADGEEKWTNQIKKIKIVDISQITH